MSHSSHGHAAPGTPDLIGHYKSTKEHHAHHGHHGAEEKAPTLKDTLDDKRQSALFGVLLEKKKADPDLVLRLAEGKLTSADLNTLSKYNKEFFEATERARSIEENITEESIERYAANSPELQKIIELSGADGAAEAVKNQLEILAIKDGKEFKNLLKSIKTLEDHKTGKYKDFNDSVMKLCEEHKIDPERYVGILANPDPAERKKELRKALKESYSVGNHISNFFSFGIASRLDRKALMKNAKNHGLDSAAMELQIQSLSDKMGDVGKMLSTTINKNEDVREALSYVIAGKDLEELEPDKLAGFKDAQSLPTKQEVDKEWEDYKVVNKLDAAKWKGMNATQQEDERVKFRDQLKTEMKKKAPQKGFWYTLFASIMGNNVDKHSKNLK